MKNIQIHFCITCNFDVFEICLNAYIIICVMSLNVNTTDSYQDALGENTITRCAQSLIQSENVAVNSLNHVP